MLLPPVEMDEAFEDEDDVIAGGVEVDALEEEVVDCKVVDVELLRAKKTPVIATMITIAAIATATPRAIARECFMILFRAKKWSDKNVIFWDYRAI
jgi:hypothetical protein